MIIPSMLHLYDHGPFRWSYVKLFPHTAAILCVSNKIYVQYEAMGLCKLHCSQVVKQREWKPAGRLMVLSPRSTLWLFLCTFCDTPDHTRIMKPCLPSYRSWDSNPPKHRAPPTSWNDDRNGDAIRLSESFHRMSQASIHLHIQP